MNRHCLTLLVVFVALFAVLQPQSFGASAIAVQKLRLTCDNKKTIDAIFYWNPDHARLTIGKKILLLPKVKSTSGFRYKNKNAALYTQKKSVIFSENGKETTCRIKR